MRSYFQARDQNMSGRSKVEVNSGLGLINPHYAGPDVNETEEERHAR